MSDYSCTPQHKSVLAISISTGWAVRNFFQTGIIGKLQDSFQLLVFTTPAIHENLLRQGYGAGIDFIVRDEISESLSWRLFRQIKKKLYMESRKSSTEAIWEKYVKRPLYQKLGGLIIPIILRFVDVDRLLGIAENLDFSLNNSRSVDKIFQQYKPSAFFATHASTFFEESLLHSSIKNKVPATFMVLSWDHLSSKVILCSKYESILVWNKITKSEILETSTAYGKSQISIVGVPQYDCYAERPTISYAEWCRKYGLDPSRRTILFSTMPQVRHEQQHIILEMLLGTIHEGKLPGDLQVLIKCHPFDNTDKYDFLLERDYHVAICRSTLSVGSAQDEWFPSLEEMYISRDSLYFCDININIFSTVTLEAAYYDKPIVHIAFDPNPVINRIPCSEYYNFEHFKGITNSGASILVNNYNELFAALNKYLEEPSYKKQQRKELVDMYFVSQEITAAESVVNYFKQKMTTAIPTNQTFKQE